MEHFTKYGIIVALLASAFLAQGSTTELRMVVQMREQGGGVVQSWIKVLEKQINNMGLLGNYTLVIDYIENRPVPEGTQSNRFDQLVWDLADYVHKKRAYCMIGNIGSSRTTTTAQLTGYKNIIQIAATATAPILSDSSLYPYFLRTTYARRGVLHLVDEILKKYNWKEIAVISEEDEPMLSTYTRFIDLLFQHNRTAALTATYNPKDLSLMAERIKLSGIKIIVNFIYSVAHLRFMCEAYRRGIAGPNFVWISTVIAYTARTSMWDRPHPIDSDCKPEEYVKGFENQFQIFEIRENPDQNKNIVIQKTPAELIRSVDETYYQMFNKTPVWSPSAKIMRGFPDSVIACALGMNATIHEIQPKKMEDYSYDNGKELADVLYRNCISQQFNGLSGRVTFSDLGDRQSKVVAIQIKNGSLSKVHDSFQFDEETDKFSVLRSDKEVWKHLGGKPLKDKDVIIETNFSIADPLFYTYIALFALCAVLAIVLILLLIASRKKSVVKYSWPVLNGIISVGCVVISSVVVLGGMADGVRVPEDSVLPMCQAINTLLVFGFTLSVGAMLTKTWAIYSFFHRRAKGKKTISEGKNFIILLLQLIHDVGILVLWSVYDPLKTERELLSETRDDSKQEVYKTFVFRCSSDNLTYWLIAFLCYKGMVLLIAGFLTWPAWIISHRRGISDSNYLGISVYSCLLACIICVPVSFLTKDSPNLQYGVVGGLILVASILTVCLLLIPKLISLCSESDETLDAVNSPIGALFGFMSVLADTGALPGTGTDKSKHVFAVDMATGLEEEK